MLFLAAGVCPAWAQDYPAREVDRPLLITRGLIEMDAEAGFFSPPSVWNERSELADAPRPYELTQIQVRLKYGILDYLQVAVELPYSTGHIDAAEGSGFGDVAGEVGVRFLRRPEVLEAAGLLRVSYPTGLHDHSYDLVNGEVIREDWTTGDPGWGISPGLAAKLFGKQLALEVTGEYRFRLPGEVVQNVNLITGTADVDPGDGYYLRASALYQVMDWLVLFADVRYTALGQDLLDGHGLDNHSQLLQVGPRVMVQFSREFDAYAGFSYTAWGKNAAYGFPWFVGVRARF